MIAMEKLLILKAVTLFQQMPEDLLLQLVMTVVKEEKVSASELIIDVNMKNMDIYIIVFGRVKIHYKDQLIAELGEREIFGELSALTFDFPVFSVSAITDCLLLKINTQSLYEMMNYDVGLAKGIIYSLCKRTQSMSTQMQLLMMVKN